MSRFLAGSHFIGSIATPSVSPGLLRVLRRGVRSLHKGFAFNTNPEVERRYRGIGEGWARGVLGGSTGGWESFAYQVLYPDDFNFAVAACPDPIGFASYTTINLYKDSNAYFYDSAFKRTARPGQRDQYPWPSNSI